MKIKNILIILACLFLMTPVALAENKLSKEKIRSLFTQANDSFRLANSIVNQPDNAKILYEKSILFYEKIINQGNLKNAKLYYNLANAYFLKGDLGYAILNYRRANTLDSSDANIEKNLSFARSRRIDKVKIKTEKRVMQTLFFWHYDFSIKTKFIVTSTCFAIVCMSLTTLIWRGKNTTLVVTSVICSIILFCFFISLVIETKIQANKICGIITATQVIARQGDGQNYPESFKDPLHEGTEFDLLEQRPDWLHIKLSDNSDTWIPKTSAELI